MDEQSLISRIKTIYEKELLNFRTTRNTIYTDAITGVPVYEVFDIMLKLYSIIENDPILKNVYLNYLKNDLLTSVEEEVSVLKQKFISTSRLSFFLLVRLDNIDEALDLLQKRSESGRTFNLIVSETGLLIKIFRFRLTTDQLVKLESLIENHPKKADKAYNRTIEDIQNHAITIIRTYKFDQVVQELEGVNIEINNDKDKVIRMFTEFRFDLSLNNFLKELDDLLYTDNEIIISALVGKLRSFMEEFTKGLGKKILDFNHEELPDYLKVNPKIGELGRYRKYITSKLDITEEDDKFITAFVKILHQEGGHSMMSKKEYLKLARNIGIEVTLFMLTKYQVKYSRS